MTRNLLEYIPYPFTFTGGVMDLVYLFAVLAFFGVTAALAAAFEKLRKR